MEDRRVFARIGARLPVKFLNPENGMEGRADTFDISANGLGLITAEELSAKTPLEMWLNIPDQRDPLYTRGEVIWSGPSVENGERRVGVHLEKAELMGLARILWLKRR